MQKKQQIEGKYNGSLRLEYLDELNYSMVVNGVKACLQCIVKNNDDRAWPEVELSMEGELLTQSIAVLNTVEAHQAMSTDQLQMKPNMNVLASITEAAPTHATLTVKIGGETVASLDCEFTMLPYNQWPGLSVMPELLSAFVTPNHPALSAVNTAAAKYLEKWTGSSSLDAYQTQDRNRVRYQVAAVYEALRAQGIVYSEAPANFVKTGQRIRLADQVLSEKMGTCIDTTLLMASCLESIGIHPLIIIQEGHTFVGAWLDERCYSHNIGDDYTSLTKESADGIHNVVLVETTNITSSSPASFEDATTKAEQEIRDERAFVLFVDVCHCRLDGIKPLPQRLADGSGFVNDGVEHDTVTKDIEHLDHYSLHLDEQKGKVTKQTLWERKLLDFSLRNNLINCRLSQRVIPFVTFEMETLEDNMQAGQDYMIQAFPGKLLSPTESGIYDSKFQASDLAPVVKEEIKTNHRLTSYLSETELAHALKNIYRSSRNALEENGANTLFVALGMLKWYENDRSQQPRFAPVILMPVDIIRKSYSNYLIRTRDEETIINITILELLKQQFNINLTALNPLPTDQSGVDVKRIISTIRDAIRNMARWDVMEEAFLGLFSFNKFVMWNDIHNNADHLRENEVVKSLMEGRVALTDVEDMADARKIDKESKPADYAIPIDVDSSQLEAVVESGKGKSFILYGPPGTGKSQTITNMIANALYQEKRVLFVAEKKAALDVVQKRLERIGLSPFFLELHSNKVTKSHFLQQMKEALDVVHTQEPEQFQAMSEKLYEHRQQLNYTTESLHRQQPNGLSLYDCLSGYLTTNGEELPGQMPKSADITKEKLDQWKEMINDLATIFDVTGHPNTHPLKGLNPKQFAGDLSSRLDAAFSTLLQQADAVSDARTKLPLTLTLSDKDLNWVLETERCMKELPTQNRRAFVEQDANCVLDEWKQIAGKWFLPRFFARRSFMNRFRQFGSTLQPADVEPLMNAQKSFRQKVKDYCMAHDAAFTETLNTLLDEMAEDRIGQLSATIRPLKDTCSQLLSWISVDRGDSNSLVETLRQHIRQWQPNLGKLKDWTLWTDRRQQLEQEGLKAVTAWLESTNASPAETSEALKKRIYHLLTTEIVENDSELSRFNGLVFEDIVEKYRQETRLFQELTKQELYCRLAARVPSQTLAAVANSEMGILKRNISNGGRGSSVRKIIDQIPTLLPKLCPCMLMSPLSVAQYLDMNNEKFDLVIFDEASQMPTSEAVGAIARGKALVCVGDPKQMPPTSFFVSQSVDEEEADIDDMDSILDDCITLSMPGHYLSWHYRSRHESLIAFSNTQYYEGKLRTFPSTDNRSRKVQLVQIEGTYDKGRTRSNRAEAEAIVSEVVRRLSDAELSKQSIGIVSFSKVQQDLIEDILLERLSGNPQLEQLAFNVEEPIFIKNLENVQGDERDVILFSVGYGPDSKGHVSMNFGPLNNEGGERRLNVAVSRARSEMIIFSTLRPEQIDLKRSQAKGVEGLKNFLEFAKTGTIINNASNASSSPLSSPLSPLTGLPSLVADELRQQGFEVETMVGSSDFKVDVAVVDPEQTDRYLLGILCDGKNYHETKTARDREIVQPTVLGRLNWNLMRVWAVDWYANHEAVVERIKKKIEDIRNHKEQAPAEPEPAPTIAPLAAAPAAHTFPLPNREGRGGSQSRDIKDIPMAEIKKALVYVTEQSISLPADDLKRVAAQLLGFSHRGSRIDAVLDSAIAQLIKEQRLEERDGMIKFHTFAT